jgi:hypothetical protein
VAPVDEIVRMFRSIRSYIFLGTSISSQSSKLLSLVVAVVAVLGMTSVTLEADCAN